MYMLEYICNSLRCNKTMECPVSLSGWKHVVIGQGVINIAQGRPAFQSSQWGSNTPDKAVNGNNR